MIFPSGSIFTLMLSALSLTACQTTPAHKNRSSNPESIGVITKAKAGALICRNGDCIVAAGQGINSGDSLKSGNLNMQFTLIGENGTETSHKLLGMANIWTSADGNSAMGLIDGTLSGAVEGRPMHISFISPLKAEGKRPYCEFSNGQYSAVNYIIIRFEIQKGTAICTDADGKKHRITNGVFEGDF